MKMPHRHALPLLALCMALFLSAPDAWAGENVNICHYTKGTTVILNVSSNALPGHLAHGDAIRAGNSCAPVQDVIAACMLEGGVDEVFVDFNPLMGEFYLDEGLYAKLKLTGSGATMTVYEGGLLHDVAGNADWSYAFVDGKLVTEGIFVGASTIYEVKDASECEEPTSPPDDTQPE